MSGFRSVDLTRGFMVDGWSFGHFTNKPKNLATCVQQYHNSRFVGGIDLTVMNDLSNGNSLVRNGQTHTWNCPPPNTMAERMCSQRHEMTKSEIRRLQTNEDAITMLANTVRDQVVRDP
eukprot:scaffold14655_cov106-Skeletonema_menzelii.AAC.1